MASLGRNQTGNYTRPPPSYRHAIPSAPWPWINLYDEIDADQLSSGAPPIPPLCDHSNCGGCWRGYPQSRFPNWTSSQVRRSGIYKAVYDYNREQTCDVYHVDVDNRGFFKDAGIIRVTEESKDEYWEQLIRGERPDNLRVRALFIDNLSSPVLQILGAKYNMEPLFFSSSLSWIPSRFQEDVQSAVGDHITITLTFPRTVIPEDDLENASRTSISTTKFGSGEEHVINTGAPLFLHSGKGDSCYLVIDLLSVHLIRNIEGNTLISYHHIDKEATSAPYLHERIRFAGQSVYWQNILQNSSDPTFLLLVFIWHAMYAWDEALEKLYSYICYLESQLFSSSSIQIIQAIHVIRAHYFHYTSLLEDFRESALFILNTPNPVMDSETITEAEQIYSRRLLERECSILLAEIGRLEARKNMHEKRLENVLNFVFTLTTISDAKAMQRDSTAMKQIAYLTMVFLPASFIASIFGMNIKEIAPDSQATLYVYFAIAVPFTALTIWALVRDRELHTLLRVSARIVQGVIFIMQPVTWVLRSIKKYGVSCLRSNRDAILEDGYPLNGSERVV